MMRALLVWLVVVSIFVYSYFGSFAYFSDSTSIRLSLQMEQTSVQISCENLTLLHCHCPCSCGYYILWGIIVNTTSNSTLDGIYFNSRGWVLGGVIVDNSSFNAGASPYLSLNATLSPGVHNVSLILYKTNSCRNKHVIYLVFYVNGDEYLLSIVPRWCRR